MCDGCWFGNNDCGDSSKRVHALAPSSDQWHGQIGTEGSPVAREKDHISVVYVEQMKHHSNCLTQFIGVAEDAQWVLIAGVRRQEATV